MTRLKILTLAGVSAWTACGTTGPDDAQQAQATDLVFSTEPADVAAGAALIAVVTAVDPDGDADADWTGPITLTLALNPGNDDLRGTLTVSPSGGRAVFPGVVLNVAAEGYRLRATSGSLVPATSGPFRVLPGPVELLHVTPSALSLTFSSGSIEAQLNAVPRDAFGNGTGEAAGWASDDPTRATVDETGYVTGMNSGFTTVRGRVGSMEVAVPVVVSCVPPRCSYRIEVTTPMNVSAGRIFAPGIEVDTDTPFTPGYSGWANVHLGINPTGAKLSGTTRKRTDVADRAVFDDLSIDRPGTYTIVAWVEGDDGFAYGRETTSFIVDE